MTTTEQRELDAWIETIVFNSQANRVTIKDGRKTVGVEFYDGIRNPIRHYTTDPAAAMEVLKKCQIESRKRGDPISIDLTHGNASCVSLQILEQDSYFTELDCEAETLELSICLFAKKLFSK